MKNLTVDFYRIAYRILKIKPLAYILALIHMSVLNYIAIHAIGLLMEGWISAFSIVHMLFGFPFSILTAIAIGVGTFMLMPSQSNITKAAKREGNAWLLLAYTIFGIMLYVFMKVVIEGR